MENKEQQVQVYTQLNPPPEKPHPKTSKTAPIYQEVMKEDGTKVIEKVGETNIYEKIQSYKEETEIYNILKRFQNGDLGAIQKTNGIYGDFTKAPQSLMEAHNQLISAEKTFNQLPIEIKKEFNNSVEQFLASAHKGDILNRINKVSKIVNENKPLNNQIKIEEEKGVKYE